MPRVARAGKAAPESEPVEMEHSSDELEQVQEEAPKATGRGKKAAKPKKNAVPVSEVAVIPVAQPTQKKRGGGKKAAIVVEEADAEKSEEFPAEAEKPVAAKKGRGGRQKKVVEEVPEAHEEVVEPEEPVVKAKGRNTKAKATQQVVTTSVADEPKKTKGRGKKASPDPVEIPATEEAPQEKKKRGGRAAKKTVVEEEPQITESEDATEENEVDVADEEKKAATPISEKKTTARGKKAAATVKAIPQPVEPFDDDAELPINAALSNIEFRKKRGAASAPTTPVVNSKTVVQTGALTPTGNKTGRGRAKKAEEAAPPKKRAAAKKTDVVAVEDVDDKDEPAPAVAAKKTGGRGKKPALKPTSENDSEETAPTVRKDRKRKDDISTEPAKKTMKQK